MPYCFRYVPLLLVHVPFSALCCADRLGCRPALTACVLHMPCTVCLGSYQYLARCVRVSAAPGSVSFGCPLSYCNADSAFLWQKRCWRRALKGMVRDDSSLLTVSCCWYSGLGSRTVAAYCFDVCDRYTPQTAAASAPAFPLCLRLYSLLTFDPCPVRMRASFLVRFASQLCGLYTGRARTAGTAADTSRLPECRSQTLTLHIPAKVTGAPLVQCVGGDGADGQAQHRTRMRCLSCTAPVCDNMTHRRRAAEVWKCSLLRQYCPLCAHCNK
jgi:hypothetical protein